MQLELVWSTNESAECVENIMEISRHMHSGCVVFDIDGTLVHTGDDSDEFLDPVAGMPEVINQFKRNGIKVIGCTARSDVPMVKELTQTQLSNAGIILDDIYFMPLGTPVTHSAISRFKLTARNQVALKYAPLHLVMGDQWSDLILCNNVNLIQVRLIHTASKEAKHIAFKKKYSTHLCIKCAFK